MRFFVVYSVYYWVWGCWFDQNSARKRLMVVEEEWKKRLTSSSSSFIFVSTFFFLFFFSFLKKILLSSFSHKNFSRISQSSLHFSAHMIFLLDFFVSRFSSVLFREFFLHCLFLIYSPFTIYIF